MVITEHLDPAAVAALRDTVNATTAPIVAWGIPTPGDLEPGEAWDDVAANDELAEALTVIVCRHVTVVTEHATLTRLVRDLGYVELDCELYEPLVDDIRGDHYLTRPW